MNSDVTSERGLSPSTALHTYDRGGEWRGICTGVVLTTPSPLVLAVLFCTRGFRKTLPEQFCNHGSQWPMKPLSKGYIFGHAHVSSLANLQSRGIGDYEDTVGEVRQHYDGGRGK